MDRPCVEPRCPTPCRSIPKPPPDGFQLRATPMRELFVYYRVDAALAPEARAAVDAMHERLRSTHPGLIARLLMRTDDDKSPQTWMETYALPGSPDGIGRGIEAEIAAEAARWAHVVAGPRHVE